MTPDADSSAFAPAAPGASDERAGLAVAAAPLRLDLRGLKCPLPVLHVGRALRACDPGTGLVVLTTDPLAPLDLANLARERGDVYEGCETENGFHRHRLRRGST